MTDYKDLVARLREFAKVTAAASGYVENYEQTVRYAVHRAADAIEQLQAEDNAARTKLVDAMTEQGRLWSVKCDDLRARVEKLEKALRDIGMGTAAADGADHCLARAARKALAEGVATACACWGEPNCNHGAKS